MGIQVSGRIFHDRDSGVTRTITEASTTTGLFINIDGNAIGMDIDSEATSKDCINIASVLQSGSVIDADLTPGAASNAELISLSNSADCSGSMIELLMSGTGHGVFVVPSTALAASKRLFYFTAAVEQSTTDALVEFESLHASSTVDVLLIDTGGDQISINIDSESLTTDVINLDAVNTSGVVVDVNLTPGVASTAVALGVTNDSSCTANMVYLVNHGNDSALSISHETTALAASNFTFEVSSTIAHTTAGSGLARINSGNASTTVPCLVLLQSGTGDALVAGDGTDDITINKDGIIVPTGTTSSGIRLKPLTRKSLRC